MTVDIRFGDRVKVKTSTYKSMRFPDTFSGRVFPAFVGTVAFFGYGRHGPFYHIKDDDGLLWHRLPSEVTRHRAANDN